MSCWRIKGGGVRLSPRFPVVQTEDRVVDLRHSQHLLVDGLESIDALLEVDIIRRELRLS